MCGIVGIFEPNPARGQEQLSRIRAMGDALRHRGPDDSGYFVDPEGKLGLGHQRLSIIDLSQAGHQPMHSRSARFVGVFNGEIYNFKEIRSQLEAEQGLIPWRGHSDTEVLLEAAEWWGIAAAARRFVGMFAFAIWDARERRLYLARDRFGEKPLYYGWSGRTFLFGSELKALAAHPNWRGGIDRDALALFLRHGYVPAPHSIYRGIRKLRPGTILSLGESEFTPGDSPEPTEFWSAREALMRGAAAPFRGNPVEAVDQLDQVLREAVSLQMAADVPLGAFLSGGVDSSTVVALMQTSSSRKVRTFSIGFQEAEYDEAEHAQRVANHLGTDHTSLYVAPAEALSVIPQLPEIYDEPFADSSQIPTYLVSALARKQVTVSLSGDGGDEIFYGYSRYRRARSLWRMLCTVPVPLRRTLAEGLQAVPARVWERGLGGVAQLLLGKSWSGRFGDRLHKLAALLSHSNPTSLYRAMISNPALPEIMLESESRSASGQSAGQCGWELGEKVGFLGLMSYLDLVGYLPEDILVKNDRAAMAVSLESRMPLLDHRVLEFACGLPETLKMRSGTGKWILRQVLYRYVPASLVDRPKMGFSVPIDHWLRGPLRGWAEGLLDHERLRAEGLFDPEPIRRMWREHQTGVRRWHSQLWTVLMFQAWHERWIARPR